VIEKWWSTTVATAGPTQRWLGFFVIALVVIAIVVYGLAVGHWFNFGSTVNVVTSPGAPAASASPST